MYDETFMQYLFLLLMATLPGALFGGIIATVRRGFPGFIAGFFFGGMFGCVLSYAAAVLSSDFLWPLVLRSFPGASVFFNNLIIFLPCLCASFIGGVLGGRAGVSFLDMLKKPGKTS